MSHINRDLTEEQPEKNKVQLADSLDLRSRSTAGVAHYEDAIKLEGEAVEV